MRGGCCKSQDSAGGIRIILRVVPPLEVRIAETACLPKYLSQILPQNPGIYRRDLDTSIIQAYTINKKEAIHDSTREDALSVDLRCARNAIFFRHFLTHLSSILTNESRGLTKKKSGEGKRVPSNATPHYVREPIR